MKGLIQNLVQIRVLVLVLVHVRLSRAECVGHGEINFCTDVPREFSPGFSSLVLVLKDVGVLNSSVLQSGALASVTQLRFEGAGLTRISAGAFGSLQNLRALSLIQNQLGDVDPSWFGGPEVLNELNLTGNRIRVLNESTFEGLTGLRKLGLSQNQISEVHLNTFSALMDLAELDLSHNRLTQVPPQVFRSLKSTRISLDGNPWDCSCEAAAFVDFLKDLQTRSLLNNPSDVTCESPDPLRGRAVWNVSVCETLMTSRPPTGVQTLRPKPTGTSDPDPPLKPTKPASETKTSVQTRPAEGPTTRSTPPESGTKTSNSPGPSTTDFLLNVDLTPPSPPASGTKTSNPFGSSLTVPHVTPPSSQLGLSDLPKPSVSPGLASITKTCKDANTTSALIVVIVIMACFLLAACFLAAKRRKHGNETVAPEKDEIEKSSRASRDLRGNVTQEMFVEEAGWRRPFTGVRAKSANAVLCVAPVAPVAATLQRETAGKEETNKHAGDAKSLDDKSSPSGETVQYLSVGTNLIQNGPGESRRQNKDGRHERSKMEKVSSWPLTATQHWMRFKNREEEEKALEVFTVGTPEILKDEKPPLDFREESPPESSTRPPESSTRPPESSTRPPESSTRPPESLTRPPESSTRPPESSTRPPESSTRPPESSTRPPESSEPDPSSDQLKQEDQIQNQEEKPGPEQKPAKRSSKRSRNRKRTDVSSRAPSGGASPDDETLLSGNQNAFMDLLHEVTQNNGRWTRERWRQRHGNEQRC